MRRLSAYRVFLTRNTEYHVRGHVCFGSAIAVRAAGPPRLGARQASRERFPRCARQDCSISSPQVGEPLWLLTEGGPHGTSPLLAIEERAHLEPDALDARLRAAAQPRPGDSIRDTW